MARTFEYHPELYRTADAEVVLAELSRYLNFNTVLDIGCGSGTWLQVATKQFRITEMKGVDSSHYDAGIFHIPPENYLQHSLDQSLQLEHRYDLVLCLEVAEHLPKTAATTLIESLISHSDIILFSAAIPGQGGQNHINEQWQSWWQQHFAAAGYTVHDIIRPAIWNHPKVLPWYKQNILLYVKSSHPLAQQLPAASMLDLVHPEIFKYKLDTIADLARVKEATVFYPSFQFAVKALAKSLLVTPFRK